MLKPGLRRLLQNVFPVPQYCTESLKRARDSTEVSLCVFAEEKHSKTKQHGGRTPLSRLNAAARLLVGMENKPFAWRDAALSDANPRHGNGIKGQLKHLWDGGTIK